ncbi:MAG: STN domain-containing protein, partial [Gammaproteobacteria bacterium]
MLLDLPAQPLVASLAALAAAADLKIEADPALLAGRDAPALTGNQEPADALAALLEGSGLEASRRDDGSYAIAAAPD